MSSGTSTKNVDAKIVFRESKVIPGLDELSYDEIELVRFMVRFVRSQRTGSCTVHKDGNGKTVRVQLSPVYHISEISQAVF